jgi:ethanolamine utilization protein EutN
MYVGKVTGMIIATTKNEGLVGKKLLIVQPLDMKCNPVGDCEVAVDTVGAGTGEIVLVATGSSARQVFEDLKAPIDRSIVAIIDHIEVNQ